MPLRKTIVNNWTLARYKGSQRKAIDMFETLEAAKNESAAMLGIAVESWEEKDPDKWYSSTQGDTYYVIAPGSGLPTLLVENPGSLPPVELVRHQEGQEPIHITTLRAVDDAMYHACERFGVPTTAWQQTAELSWQTESAEFIIQPRHGVTRNDVVNIAEQLGIPLENVLDGDQALEHFGAKRWLKDSQKDSQSDSIAANQAKQRTAKQWLRSLWSRLFPFGRKQP